MKKDWLKISVIFFITIGTVFFALSYLFLNNNTSRTSKATANLIDISYDKTTITAAAGQDFTITVKINPTQNISLRGYDVGFTFNKSILQLKSITYKLGVVSAGLGDTASTISQVNADGHLDAIGEIQNSTGLVIASGSSVDLLILTFTATSATGTTISGNKASFYNLDTAGAISSDLIANIPDILVNGGTGPAACTSFRDDFSGTTLDTTKWTLWTNNNGTVTATGEAKLNLPASPDSTSKGVSIVTNKINGDFTAEVLLKSMATLNNKQIADLYLNFKAFNDGRSFLITRNSSSSAIITVVNNDGSAAGNWESEYKDVGLTKNTPVKVKLERTGSTAKMYYDLQDGQNYRLARTYNNFYSGEGNIDLGLDQWAPDYPDTTGVFDSFSLTCAATLTPTGTTGGGGGNVKLNLKLKFQGITGKPDDAQNSMTVTAKLLKDATGAQPVSGTGTFTADSSGIWSGTIGFNLADVSGKYFLLVSGDKSMAKKFCDSDPTETSPGTYHCSSTNANITLAAGDNNFDLSNAIILAGDLNQDGIVDSVDFSIVKNLLGKTDADSLSQADVNHDGVVDTQDVSLIITALSFKLSDSF